MRILGKILKYGLWLLLLLVLLLALTMLSWWMEWPLATGLVILVGLLGLVLAFYGLRALYRWRDKRRFVRKVLDEQARQQADAPETAGGRSQLGRVWDEGMGFLKRSPLRFQERIQYSQPWFVTLDGAGAPSAPSVFAPFGGSLPERPGAPLTWHFLSSAVLLRCADPGAGDQGGQSDWEELLASLAANRRKAPLRGMVALLGAAELLAADDETLAALGRRLRARAQQLMLAMNRHYPVYVLVQGLEELPGMTEVMAAASREDLDAALGLAADDDTADSAGRDAAIRAAACLEDAIRAAAAEGRAPRGDMLRALETLRSLGERLQAVVEQLSRDISHQVRPRVRGVFFCEAGTGQAGERPRFLSGLLGTVLPATPQPHALTGGLPFVASTRVVLMGAWLAFMLFVCGLFAVNAVYQQHVLSLDDPMANVSHDEVTNRLYRDMLHARRLEKARRAWRLPTFGQDMLGRVEREVKRRYVLDVNTHILAPMLADFRAKLGGAEELDHALELDIVHELTWLCDAVSDRLQKKRPPTGGRTPFPLTQSSQDLWTPVTGQLLTSAMEWVADGEQLDALAQDMRGLLTMSLTRPGANLLADILANVNRRIPAAELCMSEFWPHINLSDEADVCVPPAYTAAGHLSVRDTLEDIESIAPDSRTIGQRLEVFREEYYADYAALWRHFIGAFGEVRDSLLQGDVFNAYAEVKRIEEAPHMRLFLRLPQELEPLSHAEGGGPAWVNRFVLHDTVVNIALTAHNEGAASRLQSLFSVATTTPQLLQELLSETHSAHELRELYRATDSLRQFFDDYLALLKLMGNPAKSLELARIHYGGAVYAARSLAAGSGAAGSGEDDEDLFTQAERNLEAANRPFAGDDFSTTALLSGMLDFVAQGCTVQAARTLQKEWEGEVLGSPTALYRQDDVEALFGEKGAVRTFAEDRLKPFLTRWDKAPAPARWNELSFPFTADFLTVLAHAEVVAAEPAQEAWYVLLRSQPTLVNLDAKERPDATELSLQCQDRKPTLLNRNYPHEARFQYDDNCGPTELSIRFPSFSLERRYRSFTDFLLEFQYGERVFTPTDFPEAADRITHSGIKTITVRILPDNVAGLLRRAGTGMPPLPDRITYTW